MSHILAAGAARMKLEAGNYEARIAALEAQLDELAAENERLKRLNNGLHDEVQFMRKAAKEARETLASTGAVKVKPLEWHKSEIIGWNGDWHTVPTAYSIRCADENGWKWSGFGGFGYERSDEAAKAAAQADYERRILSALEATPPAPKVTDAMVEAASREYMRIFGKHLLSEHARLILTAAQEAGKP